MMKSNNNETIRCRATRNTKSLIQCKAKITPGKDLCGVHRRCKIIVLPNGSVWKNEHKHEILEKCKRVRDSLHFWEILSSGVMIRDLKEPFVPRSLIHLRQEKTSFVYDELSRLLGFRVHMEHNRNYYVSPERHFWFLNLIYYLGNRQQHVRTIQRFCRGPFLKYMNKRKKSVKVIIKCFQALRMKRLLPIMVKHARVLFRQNCINLRDPISQDFYVDVPPERWVICPLEDSQNTWWFDVTSAVQLLGSPGSRSGENPFNRQPYPPEFILEADLKIEELKYKYHDVAELADFDISSINRTGIGEADNDMREEKESTVSPCFSYSRFQEHVKATRLFESFKEHGYSFPKKIFMKLSLGELRLCALKILEHWLQYPEEERIRVFPENRGNIFNPEFVPRIALCGSAGTLRHALLDAGMRFAVHPSSKSDRATGCISILMILGTLNQEAHRILTQYGLCDCLLNTGNQSRRYHDHVNVINQFTTFSPPGPVGVSDEEEDMIHIYPPPPTVDENQELADILAENNIDIGDVFPPNPDSDEDI